MERLKDQKADQKDSALAPLLETEVCSDFGFIEAALKCTVIEVSSAQGFEAAVAGQGLRAIEALAFVPLGLEC